MEIIMEEKVLLKDPDHDRGVWSNGMMRSLDDMRQKNVLCDVVVVALDDTSLGVHSAVLGAGSNFFRNILSQPRTMGAGVVIKLEKDKELVAKIVEYLYTGITTAHIHEIQELMQMAQGYGMNELAKLCEESWISITASASELALSQEKSQIRVFEEEKIDESTEIEGVQEIQDEAIETQQETQIEVSETARELYACKICQILFSDVNDLKKHEASHGSEAVPIMEVVSIEENEDQDVLDALASVNGEKQFGTFFVQTTQAKRQMRVPGGPRKTWRDYRYTCSFCKKEFTSASRLRGHEATHRGERRHTCNICGAKFIQIEYLREHVTMHSTEKPFQCDICNTSFRLMRHLKKHKQIHTNEFPFPCEHCHMAFRKKVQLVHHIRKHTGEKPYECGYCLKKFRCKEGLVGHQKTLHGQDSPYRCGFCGAGFMKTEILERHQSACTHTKSIERRSLQCDECHLFFKSKMTLARHMRWKHNRSNIPSESVQKSKDTEQSTAEVVDENKEPDVEINKNTVEIETRLEGVIEITPDSDKNKPSNIYLLNEDGGLEDIQLIPVPKENTSNPAKEIELKSDTENPNLDTLMKVIQGEEVKHELQSVRDVEKSTS